MFDAAEEGVIVQWQSDHLPKFLNSDLYLHRDYETVKVHLANGATRYLPWEEDSTVGTLVSELRKLSGVPDSDPVQYRCDLGFGTCT